MLMSFKDFVFNCEYKNKARSNIKNYQVLPCFSLNDVGIYSRDRPFETHVGTVNLHHSEGTHWVVNIN